MSDTLIQPATTESVEQNGLFVFESQDAAASSTEGQPVPDAPTPAAIPPVSEGASPAPETAENAAASTREWEPAELPGHLTPEDAYGAAKYHQSRYDQAQAQIQEMQAQAEQMRQLEPVTRAIMQDPELLETVAQRLRGTSQAQPAAPQAPVELGPPPTPPADLYSEDGEKYFRELATYQTQATAVQQQRIAQLEAQLGQYSQVQQQQQQQVVIQQAIQEAQFQHGMTRPEAEQFVDYLVTGKAQTPEAQVAAFRASRRPSADEVRRQTALSDAQQRQQHRTPATATAQGGGSPPNTTPGLIVPTGPSFDPFDMTP